MSQNSISSGLLRRLSSKVSLKNKKSLHYYLKFRNIKLLSFVAQCKVLKSYNPMIEQCYIIVSIVSSMNVELKGYLVLCGSLGNVFPWITIMASPPMS